MLIAPSNLFVKILVCWFHHSIKVVDATLEGHHLGVHGPYIGITNEIVLLCLIIYLLAIGILLLGIIATCRL